MSTCPREVKIITGDNEVISTNKYLLSFSSQILRDLLKSPCCSPISTSIFLPDFSSSSVKDLLNIVTNGEINGNRIKVMEMAEILAMDWAKMAWENIYIGKEQINLPIEHGTDHTIIDSENRDTQVKKESPEGDQNKMLSIVKDAKKKNSLMGDNNMYHCKECDYKAKRKLNLNCHIEAVHEGCLLYTSDAADE